MQELNLTRGKPSPEQLNLSSELISILEPDDFMTEAGFDCRNYGLPYGIPELRQLFSEILGVDAERVLVPAAASLELMYDTVLYALSQPFNSGDKPWISCEKRKWLCPIPGYDRHFAITENLGFEMIPINMDEEGPIIAEIERALAEYGSEIKGMWIVPVYSNPTGITYSAKRCRELLSLKYAQDFRILCDMAYVEHHLTDRRHSVPNLVELAAEVGNPDLCFLYASMSKITFPGGSTAAVASSAANIEWYQGHLKFRQISSDKLNQLRHMRFFPNVSALREHMQKQAAILNPKFLAVIRIFKEKLSSLDGVSWTEPEGGYFIGLTLPDNTAKAVVEYCKERGLALTPAGSPFPNGQNPRDNFLRIAPSFPPLSEVEQAAHLVAEAVHAVCK